MNKMRSKIISRMATLTLILLLLPSLMLPLCAMKKVIIMGKVVDKKTGKGIPNVKFMRGMFGKYDGLTNINGDFVIKNDTISNGYYIKFIAPPPYSSNTKLWVTSGDIDKTGRIFIRHTLGKGSSLMGKVYLSNGTPLSNASVTLSNYDLRLWRYQKTKTDGSYFFDRLSPRNDYTLKVSYKMPGVAFRFLKKLSVEDDAVQPIENIYTDSYQNTRVEGVITSSLDGKPLPGAMVSLYYYHTNNQYVGYTSYGKAVTNSEGYYSIRNIDNPGKYMLRVQLFQIMKKFIEWKEFELTIKPGQVVKKSTTFKVPGYQITPQIKKRLEIFFSKYSM